MYGFIPGIARSGVTNGNNQGGRPLHIGSHDNLATVAMAKGGGVIYRSHVRSPSDMSMKNVRTHHRTPSDISLRTLASIRGTYPTHRRTGSDMSNRQFKKGR